MMHGGNLALGMVGKIPQEFLGDDVTQPDKSVPLHERTGQQAGEVRRDGAQRLGRLDGHVYGRVSAGWSARPASPKPLTCMEVDWTVQSSGWLNTISKRAHVPFPGIDRRRRTAPLWTRPPCPLEPLPSSAYPQRGKKGPLSSSFLFPVFFSPDGRRSPPLPPFRLRSGFVGGDVLAVPL